MGRIGVATLPHAKAGRLPYGLSSQESLSNRLNGRRANGRSSTGVCTSRRDVSLAATRPMFLRQVRRLQTRIVKATQSSCVTGCRKTPLQRLEPCGSKDPRTVLRGLGAGNRIWLPDGRDDFIANKNGTTAMKPIPANCTDSLRPLALCAAAPAGQIPGFRILPPLS